MPKVQFFSIISIALSVLTVAMKILAYLTTHSMAFLSDATDNALNIATSLLTFLTVCISKKPADRMHPFGHYKAEYLSAIIEGILVWIAGLYIVSTATSALLKNNFDIYFNPIGVIWNLTATILNGIWAYWLITQGKKETSFALEANGYHLLTDVWASCGVIASVVLVFYTHIKILDPIIAIIVGLHILWIGWKIIKPSIDGLMDTAPSNQILNKIQTIIINSASGAREFHDLRCRASGPILFIEFHLVVDSLMSVQDAHNICTQTQNALKTHFPKARIIVHLDPDTNTEPDGIPIQP